MKVFYKNLIPHSGSTDMTDFSLHYGCAVFEGIRSYKTTSNFNIVDLEAHIDRLFRSAEIVNRPIRRFSKDEILNLIVSHVESSEAKDLYIRPMITFGNDIMGLRTPTIEDLWVIFMDFSLDYSSDKYTKGVKLGISNERKSSSYAKAKVSSNYLTPFVALGHDASTLYDDMVLTDQHNNICETSAQNIFFIKKNDVFTPRSEFALSGITQSRVIDTCKYLGMSFKEDDIKIDDISTFDEVFLTGTACEIVPVASIENIEFNAACSDSNTRAIHKSLKSQYTDI